MTSKVAIAELRQNLSKHLQRVKTGEQLIVTDRNRPVAALSPLPERPDLVDVLILEGNLTPPINKDVDFHPVDLGTTYAGTDALDQVRGEN